MSPSDSQQATMASSSSEPREQNSMPAAGDPPGGQINSKDIEAIKTDLAALRMAIDMVRAQYEERIEEIREAHQSILAELGDQEGTGELGDEVKNMEAKMEMLESQAGGLESALDRYTELFMEEVKEAADGGTEAK